jgi:ferredoxin
MNKIVEINYFSGCGNSKILADKTKEIFLEKGFESKINNIEKNINSSDCDILGIILPIYGFGLPKAGNDFIKNLPPGNGKKAFILFSAAGHEGVAIVQAFIKLKFKGYDVICSRTIYMPDTWTLVQNAPTPEKFHQKKEKAYLLLDEIINNIIQNKKKICVANPISLICLGLIHVLFYFHGRQASGKLFYADENCVSCKFCFKNCPSQAIEIHKEKPYWNFNCQQCFRCINLCPKNAVQISGFTLLMYIIFIILGWKFYKLISFNFQEVFGGFNNLVAFIYSMFFSLAMLAIYSFISNKTFLKKFLPVWSITNKRKRYKISEFSAEKIPS